MNRAKQLRLDSGGEVVDTAREAGIGTRTLHKIEAGETVQVDSLKRLADFYGVRPSELLAPADFEAAA